MKKKILEDTKKNNKQKDFWFKIEGLIYAEDKYDAYEQIRAMAISGKNCERAFYHITEGDAND